MKNLSVNLVQLKTKQKYSVSPKQEGSVLEMSHFIDKYPSSVKGRSHRIRARAIASNSITFLNPTLHPNLS